MTEYLGRTFDLNSPDFVDAIDELNLWSAMFDIMLLKYIKMKPNLTVLDVACGAGVPLLELAQRLGSSSFVYGLDLWSTALVRAKRKAAYFNIQNIEVIEGDAYTMPFKNSKFDLIVSNTGINNFENTEVVLAECARVAKPKAHIVLTTNLKGHMKEFYQVFNDTLKELNKEKYTDALRKNINHRLTIKSISDMLEKVGFHIAETHRENVSMRFVDGSSFFRHYFIQIGFLDGWKAVISPEDQKEVFSRLEENLNRWAESKGELKLTIPIAYIEGVRS